MEFTRRETAILASGDFLILIASLWAALAFRNLAVPSAGYFADNLIPFVPVFLLSLVVFYIAGLYEKQTRLVKREMGMRILGAQAANTAVAAVLFFALPLQIAPKTILALYLLVSVASVSLWRFYRTQRERAGHERAKALLIANGSEARDVFDEVNGSGRFLFSFVAHLDPAGLAPHELATRVDDARKAGVSVVVIDTHAAALTSLYDAMVGGVAFLEFSALYEDVFDRVPLGHIDHAWLLECLPKRHSLYDVAKRAFDLVFGVLAFVVAAPFIGVAALLVRLAGGAAFIRNERVGQGGRRIEVFKLRTMLLNDRGDPALRAQNRVTRIGALLRKSRIDELPQLWNVMRGDLSFIGPRPELPSIAAVYEREIPYYHARHVVVPGLSGWAQLHHYDAPKGGADIEKTRMKLSYDLYYLKRRSFGLDLAIALKTFRALASFSGT